MNDDDLVEPVAQMLDEMLGDLHVGGDMLDMNDLYNIATPLIALIRRHDEQAALDCGHCSEPDDIRCACEVAASHE